MGKFFTVVVKPDIVKGDISNVIDSDTSDLDVGDNDVVFDWVEIDVPSGSNMLRSISMFVNGPDTSAHASNIIDYDLIFAKSFNGSAPQSIGTTNTAPSAANVGWPRQHWIGTYKFIGANAVASGTSQLGSGFGYTSNGLKTAPGGGLPMILDLEPGSGTNVGYDKLYMAGVHGGARDYNTGVIVNGAITSDTEDTITVDGVDAREVFSVGDTVYLHDVDTALGTVKSVPSATSIVLNAAIAGGTDLADDDELVNANPFVIRLGFER